MAQYNVEYPDKRLKQIAGRCREDLLSETVIYDLPPSYEEKLEEYDSETLINTAKDQLKGLNCLKKHYYHNELLKQNFQRVRELIIEQSQTFGHRLLRNIKTEDPKISYLNIDSILEGIRVRNEVYSSIEMLPTLLKKADHLVKEDELFSATLVESKQLTSLDRATEVDQVLDKLKNLKKGERPKNLLESQGSKKFTILQRYIIERYEELYEYIDNEQLLALIQAAAVKRDDRQLKNLFLAAHFISNNPNEHFRRTVNFHIKIGETYHRRELFKKWKIIYDEMNLNLPIESEIQAVKQTNLYYNCKKLRDKTTRIMSGDFQILSENPMGFKVLGEREPFFK